MASDLPPVSRRRRRRVALLLLSAALILVAGGGIWFIRFAARARRDPALIYREPATLDKLLQRANEAERAGDRATAITTYRFVMTVGQGAGAELTPYVVAARAGLNRLGAADIPPGPSR
ncbi:MAG TPA: hypothetical protein VH137_01990 [Gemmatimonadales bacterium]|jgi:hypothetical protein|nr:hypothetical protein [Gemmatimonadales bacterium]